MTLTVGDRLWYCDVTALIGEGGMGEVYRATDTKLNRQACGQPLDRRADVLATSLERATALAPDARRVHH